jgi:hypothetical protein
LAKPLVFSGGLSGALVVLFKIVLILPLVRLGIAGYELLEAANDAAIEREDDRRRRGQRYTFRNDGDLWIVALVLSVATAVIAGATLIVFDPASAMNRWLAAHLAPGISVGRVHLPPAYLQTAPQWIGTVALLYFTGLMADFASFGSDSAFRSVSQVISGVLTYLAMLCLLTLIGVAISLTLLHVGLVRTQSSIPPHAQVWAAINAYIHTVTEAIPGLEVPKQLEWTLSYPFVGIVSGTLFLLYKIAFLGVLLVPMKRIVRSFVQRLRPRTVVPALTAPGEFITLLRTVQWKLDELQRSTLAKRAEKKARAARAVLQKAVAMPAPLTTQTGLAHLDEDRHPEPFATLDALTRWRDLESRLAGGSRPTTLSDIDDLIGQLEEALARVTTLFGEGEIRTCADAALTAVLLSKERVRDLYWDYLPVRGESTTERLSNAKADLKEKTESFSKLAAKALAQQRSVTLSAKKD